MSDFRLDPKVYFLNNSLRVAFLNFILFFSLFSWIIKEEGEKILYSLKNEKTKILKKTIYFLAIFSILHFIIRIIVRDKSEKIKELIGIIDKEKKNWWHLSRIFFGLCFLAPLYEEIIYRYWIFRTFGKNNRFSYFLSFVTFVLTHYCWNWENFFVLFAQYGVASFALVYIYKKSNWNVLYPMLLHSLINLFFISIALLDSQFFLI